MFKLNLTFSFMMIAVSVFVAQNIVPIDWNMFAFTPAYASQRPWTFITSMFMHADVSHIFFNMFAMFMFGLPLEGRIGSKKYLWIFFISGIVGSLGYMLTGNPLIPAIGMSGAIYGLMGTLAFLMPSTMVFIGGLFPMPMIFAVFFWGVSEFIGLFSPGNIARGAHLGGLFIGIMFGLYLRWKENRSRPKSVKINLSGYADWEV